MQGRFGLSGDGSIGRAWCLLDFPSPRRKLDDRATCPPPGPWLCQVDPRFYGRNRETSHRDGLEAQTIETVPPSLAAMRPLWWWHASKLPPRLHAFESFACSRLTGCYLTRHHLCRLGPRRRILPSCLLNRQSLVLRDMRWYCNNYFRMSHKFILDVSIVDLLFHTFLI